MICCCLNNIFLFSGHKTCSTAAFISKQSSEMNSSEPQEWLKNGIPTRKNRNSLNSSQNVQFSLNKNKNWLLPEKLKYEIIAESQKGKPIEPISKKRHKQNIVDNRARVAFIEKSSNWGQRNYMASKSFINSVDKGSNQTSKSRYVFG